MACPTIPLKFTKEVSAAISDPAGSTNGSFNLYCHDALVVLSFTLPFSAFTSI